MPPDDGDRDAGTPGPRTDDAGGAGTADHRADDGSRGDGADTPPRLTEHAELHGCSCKVGQGELEELLAGAGLDADREELLFGVGEDAAARALDGERALVSTVDYFTPVVDDPHDFGRIAACNAASDAFAKGSTEALTALVVLGLPRAVTDAAPAVLGGVVDAVEAMGGVVGGGHTVLNPWPLAGAAVTALADRGALVTTRGARPGDRLYLTKPLGTQPAAGALRVRDGEFDEAVRAATDRPVEAIGDDAVAWMSTPNRAAAAAAREAGATAATDVTGYGLLGQSRTLARNAGVGVELTRLPVIPGTPPLSRLFGYGLEDGESAETSGGLLLSVPETRAGDLAAACERRGVPAEPVGRVTDGEGARLVDPDVVPVER